MPAAPRGRPGPLCAPAHRLPWAERRRPPSRMVPPSFPESPLSPRHFIAVFNSSQVAPSGTDDRAAHGSASGMLRPRRWHALLESGRRALLPRRAKCPLAWDPRSALGLPLIPAVCCQVSIRQPVIQLVLARVLRKINQRIVSNRSESLTTVFGEATSNHCPSPRALSARARGHAMPPDDVSQAGVGFGCGALRHYLKNANCPQQKGGAGLSKGIICTSTSHSRLFQGRQGGLAAGAVGRALPTAQVHASACSQCYSFREFTGLHLLGM